MHLLVWETDYDKDGFKYLLYKYTITDVDSGYLRKVILKNDKQFTFRHHSSPNQDHYKIFQNRYILSDYKIYDLELDSCISKNREEFLMLMEDKSFEIREELYAYLDKPSRDFYFNHWSRGAKSSYLDTLYAPNQQLKVCISIDSSQTYNTPIKDSLYTKNINCLWISKVLVYNRNFNITVIDTNNQELLTIPIEYAPAWNSVQIPVIWYDNEHLISIRGTHQVILINVHSKKVINFPKLENVELCGIPEFHVNELGDLYYVLYSSKKIWKVNVQDLELNEVNQIPIISELSKNFIEMHIGNIINTPNFYHNNKPIFKDSTLTSEYDYKNNWLAVRSFKSYTSRENSALKIYNLKTKQHREIQIKNFVGWVGWIER